MAVLLRACLRDCLHWSHKVTELVGKGLQMNYASPLAPQHLAILYSRIATCSRVWSNFDFKGA